MFKSHAVRSCVELHEIELRRFYDTFLAFRASGATLPATDDPSYQSPDDLAGHVLRSARNYLTWIGECVKRPVTDLDPEVDRLRIAARGLAFIDEVLAGWRRSKTRNSRLSCTRRGGETTTTSSRCSSTRSCIPCATGCSSND